MAKNCIDYYYNYRHTYKAFRINYKAFWIKYTSPLNACLTWVFLQRHLIFVGANGIAETPLTGLSKDKSFSADEF
jgi:hypothetical protein